MHIGAGKGPQELAPPAQPGMRRNNDPQCCVIDDHWINDTKAFFTSFRIILGLAGRAAILRLKVRFTCSHSIVFSFYALHNTVLWTLQYESPLAAVTYLILRRGLIMTNNAEHVYPKGRG